MGDWEKAKEAIQKACDLAKKAGMTQEDVVDYVFDEFLQGEVTQ